jgi:hypothetical protein
MKREPISVNIGSPGCRNEGLNDDIESIIEHETVKGQPTSSIDLRSPPMESSAGN